jgi:hypothetical protein
MGGHAEILPNRRPGPQREILDETRTDDELAAEEERLFRI